MTDDRKPDQERPCVMNAERPETARKRAMRPWDFYDWSMLVACCLLPVAWGFVGYCLGELVTHGH